MQTLSAYDPDVIVIRHAAVGAAARVTQATDAHVVNAGDGCHQHPTQCLLDLYTMRAARGPIDALHVAIVGDISHSRVARSNIQGLLLMGARVTLVGPPTLIPRDATSLGVEVSHDIAAIAAADVVYVLRMQHERMADGEAYVPSLREYSALWGVTSARVRPGQLVMHPGPMNRGVEIAGDVADGPNSGVIDQVRAGLVVRMAVLYDLLAGPGPADARGGPAAGRGRHRRGAGGGVMTERLFMADSAPASVVIAGGRLVDPTAGFHGQAVDIRIEGGRIAEIGADLAHPDAETIDAAGLTITPGLVDPHVHLRTPGDEDEEDIASGTRAAAAGGFVAILAMPNTSPVVDSAAVLTGLIDQARSDAVIATGFMCAITRGQQGRGLSEMGELAASGRRGLLGRRPPGGRRRHPAPRAPVQLGHGPQAGAARGGRLALGAAARCTRAPSRPRSACTDGRRWPSRP